MSDRSFPLALPGLVHVRNRIEVLRPVGADALLDRWQRDVDDADVEQGHRPGHQADGEGPPPGGVRGLDGGVGRAHGQPI